MNLLDYLLVIVEHRWKIFKTVTFFTLLALVISLIIPKEYRATATAIPAGTEGGGISSLLSGYSLDIFGRDIIIPEAYRVILESQGLRDSLIKEFDLFEVYDAEYKEAIYLKLESNVEVLVDKELGIGYSPIVGVNISVLDEDPERAMGMANFYIAYLANKLNYLNKFHVIQKYEYVESKLKETIGNVQAAEDNLRGFQDKNGLIELNEQLKAMVQSLARLEGEKERLELELAMARTTVQTGSQVYQNMKKNLDIVKNRIASLKTGKNFEKDESLIYYPTEQIPALAQAYFNLFREVEIQNKILEMITIQYEQMKFQKDKDIPKLLVLDYAQVPTYKYKPKRLLIVLAGFVLSVLLTLSYVFFSEYYGRQQKEASEDYRKMKKIVSELKSDWKRKKDK